MKVKEKIDKTEYKFACEFASCKQTEIEIKGMRNPNVPTFVSCTVPKNKQIKSPCTKFKACGACRMLDVEYAEQLNLKTKMVDKIFEGANTNKILPCVGMFYPFKFRNKLTFAVKKLGKNLSVGFYQEDSKNVIDVDYCLLHEGFAKVISDEVKKYVKLSKIYAYDDDKQTGLLRYVVVRNDGQNIMIVLVVTSNIVPGLNDFYKSLCAKFKSVSLYLNINQTDTSLVLTDNFIHKYGPKALSGSFMGIKYELSPGSFMQTNNNIASKVYKRVVEEIGAKNGDTVIDAFSGIGITSALFAKAGAKVFAIEISKSACQDAKEIAKQNGVEASIKTICGNATEILPELVRENAKASLFVDPPRSGLSDDILQSFVEAKPKKIVYLSCNPITLKANVDVLVKNGYAIKYIEPFDMFPHSKHVECLCVLELK